MPLPEDNTCFEKGTFEGFATQGLCRVMKEFPAFMNVDQLRPFRGQYVAVLDDPHKIDSDGARRLDPTDPLPADTSPFGFPNDAAGRVTIGVDGAILECRDVTIEAGQAIWFHWRFARFSWSPFNAFALFETSANEMPGTDPVHRAILAQSIQLEDQNVLYTPWTAYAWRPTARFSGTLRWVVSSGFSTTNPSAMGRVSGRPGALLIDSIELT
jgi:hypothetical protein